MNLDLENIDSAKLAKIAVRFDNFITLFESANVDSDSDLEDFFEKQNLRTEVKWAIHEETIDQVEAHSSKMSQPLTENDLPPQPQPDSKIDNENLNSIKLNKLNDMDNKIKIVDGAIEALELLVKKKSENLPQNIESQHEIILQNLQLDYEKHNHLMTEVLERLFVGKSKEVEALLKKLYEQYIGEDEDYIEYKNIDIAKPLLQMRIIEAHPDDPTKIKLKSWC